MSDSSQPMIVIGDKTSHGGTVVGGATTATTMGKQLARVGDQVTCPRCGSTTIASGDNTMIVMGQPVARHGDKTACGATLIASQNVTTVGPGGGAGRGNVGRESTQNPTTAAVASTMAGQAIGVQTHALSFLLTDEATGVPLARQPVRLLVDGVSRETVTDDEGCVQAVFTGDAPKRVDCQLLGIDELFMEDGA